MVLQYGVSKVKMIRRVVVAVSGGVDSAVAALLIKRQGFNVHGVFMKNWDLIDEHGNCSGEADLADAEWVCRRLNIPLTVVNFVKEYWNNVFGNFLQDYESGITPNPDILCNRHIKFDAFYQHCTTHLGADAIATGHYAQSSFGRFLEHAQPDTNAKLLCAADHFKDQTFFLSQMPQIALRDTMFPLGHLQKEEVKRIATEAGLDRIARKRESTGICFVGKRNFSEFIHEYIQDKPGPFVNVDTGEVIGTHNGFHFWTVGQRSRLPGNSKQLFILRKDERTNSIFVSPGTDHPALYTDLMYADAPRWIDHNPFQDGKACSVFKCSFRFQHTKPLIECYLVQRSACGQMGLMVQLAEPLRAVTPGQYAVFYRDGECLGSARITEPGPSIEFNS